MSYQAGRAYNGVLEKKNPIGIWTKKYVVLNGVVLNISDSEGGSPNASIDIGNILRGGEGQDPIVLVFVPHGTPEERLPFRAENKEKADYWYDLIRNALEANGRQKPRNCGLPDVDPRHGLKFECIPPQFLARFAQLDGAVLYWFSPVKKYGAKSLVGRHTTEDRITFVTDKCLFVTKPDSEVTRCMRITQMAGLFTNIDVKEKATDETFIVIKMLEPDYDLFVGCPETAQLVHILCTMYKHLTKGKELPVRQVKSPSDSAIDMHLSRRGNFEMKVVVPLQKEALKIALDAFAAERGITFSKTGAIKKAKAGGGGGGGSGGAAAGGGASAGASAKQAKAAKPADPLDKFFAGIGLPQYGALLQKQSVDLDVLECMDDDDIKNFGIKDTSHIQTIKSRLKDRDYLEKCRASSKVEQEHAAAVTAAAGGGGAGKGPISLDDDDDLLPASTASKPALSLDDSDDDLLGPAPQPGVGTGVRLSLDSDDDLDLPASKIAAKPITLDSDDDI